MNYLIVKPVTMSSNEIAELTGKKHFHVKRDIEKMLSELGEDASKFGCIYRDSRNRKQDEYRIPRREVEILLTGYSIPLRAKVIDRLHELEAEAKSKTAAPALPNFSNPAEAARAWAAEWEQRQALALENQQLAAENAEMHAELNLVTMDEYRSLTHRYFDPSYRQRLQWAARKLAKDRGITLEKARRLTGSQLRYLLPVRSSSIVSTALAAPSKTSAALDNLAANTWSWVVSDA